MYKDVKCIVCGKHSADFSGDAHQSCKKQSELNDFVSRNKNLTYPPLDELPLKTRQDLMEDVKRAAQKLAEKIDKDILESYLRKH